MPAAHITRLDIVQDIDAQRFTVTAHASAAAAGMAVRVALANHQNVQQVGSSAPCLSCWFAFMPHAYCLQSPECGISIGV